VGISAVVFPHTNQAVARRIKHSIGIPALGSLTDRARHPVPLLPVELLVIEMGKKEGSTIDENRSAPVLMHRGPRVEGWRRYLLGRTVRCIPYDHITPPLLGPALNPIDVVAIKEDID
jgi:hypothetical protein